MKKVVYNNDNLNESDINRVSKRIKAIITNDNDEILLACNNSNYHLPGGHIEGNEENIECLKRELKEELGADVSLDNINQIFTILYYNKDYPEKGINTKTESVYYEVNEKVILNNDETNYDDNERKGGFHTRYIKKDEILGFLKNSLIHATNEAVPRDTLIVLREYLNKDITMSYLKDEQKEVVELINKEFNYDKDYKNFELLDNQKVLLLKDKDKVVGVTIITLLNDPIKNKKTYYLDYVCVDDSYQNRGLATMMFKEIERDARENKIDKIKLTSSKKREFARQLYLREGMKIKDTDVFEKEL
jgi:ADP-ribose pyrophosphatase YjhB (NUDIX family)/N-acetylglutamate synthase-like GNAT family acetyltransferase